MIPTIGLMIGFYILTRCVDIGLRPGQPMVVRLLTVVTLIVALLGIVDLATRGLRDPAAHESISDGEALAGTTTNRENCFTTCNAAQLSADEYQACRKSCRDRFGDDPKL